MCICALYLRPYIHVLHGSLPGRCVQQAVCICKLYVAFLAGCCVWLYFYKYMYHVHVVLGRFLGFLISYRDTSPSDSTGYRGNKEVCQRAGGQEEHLLWLETRSCEVHC